MFEIYAYGGGEYLAQLFTALKLFFGSNDWSGLARLAALLGIVWITLQTLARKPFFDIKYFMMFGLVYMGLFVPKVDIAIVDRINPIATGPVVITEVPFALGLIGNVTSSIGDGLTRAYESYITLPNDFKYQKNGMLFGSGLVQSGAMLQFPDATFANDMNGWIENCGFWLITRGIVSENDLAKSDDLWQLFSDNASTLRYVQMSVYNTANSSNLWSCRDAVVNLNGRWATQIDRAATWWGRMVWPKMASADAKAAILATASGAYNEMTHVSRASSDIIKQQMMIGAVRQALLNHASSSDAAAAAVNIAQAQADAAQRTTYKVMGQTAGKWLPIFRQVVEAVTWGLLPVAAFAMLLPIAGMVFMTYVRMLLWLQLWPPVYAIINSIMTWYGQKLNIGASLLSDTSANALTLETSNSMVSVNADLMALAGYMAISVPMISWALVSAISFSGTAIASSLAGPASSAAGQAGASVAKGDVSQGNLSVDNARMNTYSANQMDTSLSARGGGASWQFSHGGAMTTYPGRQGGVVDMPLNRSAVGVNFAQQKANALSQAAENSESAATSNSIAAGMAMNATLSKGLDMMHNRGHSDTNSSGGRISENSALGQALTDASESQKSWRHSTQFNSQQAAAIMAYASAGFNSGNSKHALGVLAKSLGFQVDAGGKITGTSTASLNQALDSAYQHLMKTGYSSKMDRVKQAAIETAETSQDSGERRAAQSIKAGFDTSTRYQEDASTQRQRAQTYREQEQSTRQNSATINANAEENAYQVMEQKMGVSRAQYMQLEANNPIEAAKLKQQAVELLIQGDARPMMEQGTPPVDPNKARTEISNMFTQDAAGLTNSGRSSVTDARDNNTKEVQGQKGFINPASRLPRNSQSGPRATAERLNHNTENSIDRQNAEAREQGKAMKNDVTAKTQQPNNLLADAFVDGSAQLTNNFPIIGSAVGDAITAAGAKLGAGSRNIPAGNGDNWLKRK